MSKTKKKQPFRITRLLTRLLFVILILFAGALIIKDRQPPEITTHPATLQYGDEIQLTSLASCTDNRDKAPELFIDDCSPRTGVTRIKNVALAFDEPGEYTVSVGAKDKSENISYADVRIIVEDNIPPEISAVPDIQIACGRTIPLVNADETQVLALDSSDTPEEMLPIAAEDEISDVEMTYVSVRSVDASAEAEAFSIENGKLLINTPGDYEVVVRISDEQGNANEVTVDVSAQDVTPPEITGLKSSFSLKQDGKKPNYLKGAVATDLVDGDVSKSLAIDDSKVKYSKIGTYDLTVTATDQAGNKTVETLPVKITDGKAPSIKTPKTLTGKKGGSYKDYRKQITLSDNVTPEKDCKISIDDSAVNYKSYGIYAIMIYAEDAAGNKSKKAVNVKIPDKSGPKITLQKSSFSTTVGSRPDYDSYIKAKDASGVAQLSVDDSGVNYGSPGTYSVKITAVDNAGNVSSKSASVKVKAAPTPAPEPPVTRVQASMGGGGGTVYVTYSGSKYHSGGCRYLWNSSIPMSEADAIAMGYSACSVCR